jgi:acetyl-CoA/propionyl-CoA carboxylase biotin carboxyl carrier protein
VTELVYGVDLVEQQLRVAAGEPLALAQQALRPHGHAVEARLYAEDPAAGFLPSSGVVRRWRAPRGAGVRVDAALADGLVVQTDYDPMLAKVIAHGPDRAAALARLDRALAQLELLGVATSAPFTRALIARDDVRAGALDTGLLERVLAGGDDGLSRPADLLPAAALALALLDADALAARTSLPLAWRSTGAAGTWRRLVEADGERVEVSVRGEQVSVGDRRLRGAATRHDDGVIEASLDGVTRRYAIAADAVDGRLWIGRDGYQLEVAPARAGGDQLASAGDSLAAPMPGTVLLVNVADGDAVSEGDVLVVLESMKMELSIAAPHDGVVAGVTVKPGDKVALRAVLLEVHAPADDEAGSASAAEALR